MSWLSNRKRNICRKIMFAPDEWREVEYLWNEFKGFDNGKRYEKFGDWARQLLMWGQVEKIVVPVEPERIRGEIRRIGVNVNQIARTANISRSVSPEQLRRVQEQLSGIWDLFLSLSSEYDEKTNERISEHEDAPWQS
jgi:hypothetical protein